MLLDASKAFDRVCYNELFTMLIERNVSPFVIRFLLFMYTNQSMRVKWKDSLSDHFSIGNGVRQGAVLSPLLFTLYIDMLFIRLQDLGLGCHVGPIFAGSFGYADDVALVAPTLYAMDKMIKVCEIFADKFGLLFNPLKSKLLCYNVDNPDTVYVTLGNTTVRTSLHEKHFGNFISNNIYDINIKEHVCRFIGKTNAILCDFGCCDSRTLVNIHRTFCMDLYDCELWKISSKYTEEMHTAWRIAMRKIWKLYSRTHNNLICNIISNFTHSLEKIHISFIYNALHHPNELVRLLLHVKLASANSVFAENVRYLSFRYQITREDWNKPHSFLLGKVKFKTPLHVQFTCQTIVELCNIRDGLSFCDGLTYNNIINIGVGTGGAGGALAPPPQYRKILYYFHILTIINHSLQPSAPPPNQRELPTPLCILNALCLQ